MGRTTHFDNRVQERGISQELVDLVLKHGTQNGNKIIITKKASQQVLNHLDRLRKSFVRICDKGGIEIAADGDVLITAMNLNTRKRSFHSK